MPTSSFMARRRIREIFSLITVGAFLTSALTGAAPAGADGDAAAAIPTASPIKHVIVIIGENRSFDHVYATYVPKQGQGVANLLSRGIIHPDGSPGPDKKAAEQFSIAVIDPVSYFINTNTLDRPGKEPYGPFLPTPEVGFAPPSP